MSILERLNERKLKERRIEREIMRAYLNVEAATLGTKQHCRCQMQSQVQAAATEGNKATMVLVNDF